MINEKIVCDKCGSDCEGEYIQLPKGDLDLSGIWFEIYGIKDYIWMQDQHFCTLSCFIEYITEWVKNHEDSTY